MSDSRLAVGVDVGGTKTAVGLVSFPGCRILEKRGFPTLPDRGGEPLLEDIRREIAHLLAGAPETVAGIGIGVAEIVDTEGIVRSDNLIRWKDLCVAERLGDLGLIVVESDVRAPARVEARHGAGRGHRILLYVTVGTGIGSCLVIDGEPYSGARGGAICLGSGPLIPGSSALLEEIAAGPAIVRTWNAETGSETARAEDVLDRAAAGDPAAARILTEAGRALGTGIGVLANTLDPDAIVLGGGLGSADGLYWETMVETVRNCIWWEERERLPIRHAAFGADAGLIGAALEGMERANV